ncbi:hypothetical protein L218DRAFT_940499 [Marasmius fiardii PR-910]|nr:hypothetical protein L218DRAFT_940499 [Marasmius fiardii PR-910]
MNSVNRPTRKSGDLDGVLRLVQGVLEDQQQSRTLCREQESRRGFCGIRCKRDSRLGNTGLSRFCNQEYVQKKLLSGNSWNPNLLLSMGMHYLDEARKQLRLVSPWMEQGNLAQCLKATPSKDIDRYSLVYGVAAGLQYLHSRKIVHGDLNGLNADINSIHCVLVSKYGDPYEVTHSDELWDFGCWMMDTRPRMKEALEWLEQIDQKSGAPIRVPSHVDRGTSP